MYIADLHIHSKYSRATSRDCVPEYLDLWARKKGITLIGTGDFTHPAWRQELKDKLTPAEEGLYILKEDARITQDTAAEPSKTRFVVTGEISSIYKKNGKVRKVHNVIILPGLEEAEVLSRKLEAIGNIHSDGRPILGLDSRDLLEITLESCPQAVFIPAHIWTPHFSLFGAFSGFDTIEECFEDLTPYIHALETGLSSDPPMNWRISALDRYHLISNSDAHSPSKLGREANLLETELSYPALSRALQEGAEAGLTGTIEFFPEEGKYHYDGHRNCKLCLTPGETEKLGGKCPICGKKITIGVQHRVEQLADRPEGYIPPHAAAFESLVPLPEVIAASTGLSTASKKVGAQYEALLKNLGSEFQILREVPLEDIGRQAGPCVQEGIRRLRAGQVERDPGYDGEYGVIRLLDPSERESLNGQTSLFGVPAPKPKRKPKQAASRMKEKDESKDPLPAEKKVRQTDLLAPLNPEQKNAVLAEDPLVAVVAGPGTGKTKTLVTRIAYLVEQCGVKPSEITAVTFTKKAAAELRERLEKQLGGKSSVHGMTIGTFHSICLQWLTRQKGQVTLLDEYQAREIASQVIQELKMKKSPQALLREISQRKNQPAGEAEEDSAYTRYQEKLQEAGALDFDDLLLQTAALWWEGKKEAFPHLLVDEFQDINEVQYQLIRLWSQKGKSLFVIGDPDQSIYGFRGSQARCFERLQADFPTYREIRLVQNYRSTPEILACALPVISHNPGEERMLRANRESGVPVRQMENPSDLSEGIAVAKEINQMVGGIDMLDAQAASQRQEREKARSFSDIALLYRTHRQARELERCLRKEGIPYIVVGRENILEKETVQGIVGFFRFLLYPQESLSLKCAMKAVGHIPADLVESFACKWEKETAGPTWEERMQRVETEFSDVESVARWMEAMKRYHPKVTTGRPQKLIGEWVQEYGLPPSDEIEKLQNMAVFYTSMEEFLENLLLGQESDIMRSGGKEYLSDAVRLMTLHGSKGLEFPVVFLCGVGKGEIPLERPDRPADIEEERRLFYVGLTRAKEELYLMTSQSPSPFLSEIPPQCLEKVEHQSSRQPWTGKQLSLFD